MRALRRLVPRLRVLSVGLSVAGATVRCSGDRPRELDGLRIGIVAEPRTLFPLYATDLTSTEVVDLLYRRLADPTPVSTPLQSTAYRRGLATTWRWAAESRAFVLSLDSTARWQDGVAITARDVAFTYALLRDRRLAAPRGAIPTALLDSVSARGTHTVVLWLRQPSLTAFHDLTYGVHILPAHLLDTVPVGSFERAATAMRVVGSGPYALRRWVRGSTVLLERSARTDPQDVKLTPVAFQVLPTPQAAINALRSGQVDVVDNVRPTDVPMLAAWGGVRVVTLPSYDYAYVLFNFHARDTLARNHPVFGDATVRRALAMAVDRHAMVQNVLGEYGRAAIGPGTRAQGIMDTLPGAETGLPGYDPTGARALLEQSGWRLGPDGLRRRGGRVLRFELLVPTSSSNRRRASVLLQAMFRAVGVDVELAMTDVATMNALLASGSFDAALQGIRVDPSPRQIRDVWGSGGGRQQGGHVAGFNFGDYRSPRVDALLDSAATAADPERARALYRNAYIAIAGDVPAIFLYEPVNLLALARSVQPVNMRADAWWADLQHWTRRPTGLP